MKKSIFALALFMAFGSAAMAQRQANPQQMMNKIRKQVHGDRWIEVYKPQFVVVEDEMNSTRFWFEYDEDYMLTTLEEQSLEGSTWTTQYASSYEYDFSYNVIEILTKDVVNDEEYLLETFTYESGRLSEDLYQQWNGTNWENVSKYVYNYLATSTQVLLWEWDGGNWTPSYMFTYTENDNTEEELVQYMEGGAWQNEQKLTYTYNGSLFSGLLSEILSQLWIDNTWENEYKKTYHYSNGVYDRITEAGWDGTQFTDNAKSEYEYDSHGNATSGEYFCNYGSGWENCFGELEMAFGEDEVYEFDGVRFDAEYIDVTGVDEQTENAGFTFYPNPANEVLTIHSNDFQKAEVYSLTGAKLLESTSNKVDVKGLQAGMYLLKVYDGMAGCNARVFVVK